MTSIHGNTVGGSLFGQAVRDARLSLSYTQRQLAKKAGICHSYLCLIELGREHPSDMTAGCIATALTLDPVEMIAVCRQSKDLGSRVAYNKENSPKNPTFKISIFVEEDVIAWLEYVSRAKNQSRSTICRQILRSRYNAEKAKSQPSPA